MKSKTYAGSPCAKAGHIMRYAIFGACVECARQYTTTWRKANSSRVAAYKSAPQSREKARIRTAQWRQDNPDKNRASLARVKGRCVDADRKARSEHDGTCAVCGASTPRGRHGWHVDHVHDGSGSVRGVLCHYCNIGLGHFKDNSTLLRRAADYIDRPVRYPATKK